MSIHREKPTILEEPGIKVENRDDGTTRITISKKALRKAGHDPDTGDVPEEVDQFYYNGGDRDGTLEIPLKDDKTDHEQ